MLYLLFLYKKSLIDICGLMYFEYLSRQMEQVNLNCEEVGMVEVPLFSQNFQSKIEFLVKLAHSKLEKSKSIYTQAEELLLTKLGLQNRSPQNVPLITKRFSDYAKSGRLDAEYYQPKYDEIIGTISQYPYGYDKIGNLYILRDKNFLPNDNARYKYIELSDIGVNGEISGCTYDYGSNLPSLARRIVHTRDIIISSIEGSLQSCAIITEEYDGALCSTGFYVLSPRTINSETSLVLFKFSAIQALLKRACTGTILTAINKDKFMTISLPVINKDIQNKIADIIQQSTILRVESKRLLNLAKTAVETAIEQDESAAMELLNL